MVEHGEYFRFPGRFTGTHRPCRLRVPPGIVAAGHHVQHLYQVLDLIINALLINEMRRAHGIGRCEKLVVAFFKMSSSNAKRLFAARKVRTPAGSAGKGCWAAFCHA